MTINIKTKHIIIFIALVSIGLSGYFFRAQIKNLFINGCVKTVDKALNYLYKTDSDKSLSVSDYFGTQYYLSLFANYSYYKIPTTNFFLMII